MGRRGGKGERKMKRKALERWSEIGEREMCKERRRGESEGE